MKSRLKQNLQMGISHVFGEGIQNENNLGNRSMFQEEFIYVAM
jgi:hypothetical protein